jgi:hypothetical protein
MAFDIGHLLAPAALVHAERFDPPILRNRIKAGFGDGEDNASVFRLKPELD